MSLRGHFPAQCIDTDSPFIVELTSHHWAQFTVGRIIAYFAVGFVENVCPAYNAEVSPAATRGILSGSLMFLTGLGNLWGAGMSRAYADETADKGWIIPTAMQFVPAVLLLALVLLTPESPRWLLLHGRKQEAKQVLDKIRPRHDVDSGATATEADALEQLINQSLATEQGTWLDLFRGNYLRRTWVSTVMLQQRKGSCLTPPRFVPRCSAFNKQMATNLYSPTLPHST